MLNEIQNCFREEKVFYTKHARDEMEIEESGDSKIIETYPEDEPYPSCLIYGRTTENRPLHIVCAYATDEDKVIIITVYQPDLERWIDFERRKI